MMKPSTSPMPRFAAPLGACLLMLSCFGCTADAPSGPGAGDAAAPAATPRARVDAVEPATLTDGTSVTLVIRGAGLAGGRAYFQGEDEGATVEPVRAGDTELVLTDDAPLVAVGAGTWKVSVLLPDGSQADAPQPVVIAPRTP